MCKTVELTCLSGIFVLLLITLALNIVTLVEVSDTTELDWAIQFIDGQISSNAIADYMDLSHYPKPDEEFANPEKGKCCNDLCVGDICFTGILYLNEPTHCNNCCFRLIEPNSCVNSACKCYTNSQV